MYYDRCLRPQLHALLCPGGALHWLVDLTRSDWGADRLMHIQFRKSKGDRGMSGIQVYMGRTSPLEIRLRSKGQVEFTADKSYRDKSKHLFGCKHDIAALDVLRGDLRAHLHACSGDNLNPSFTGGEAESHAGLMRRYGLGYQTGDPIVAIDSEARVGHASEKARDGMEDILRQRLHLPEGEAMPRKLDTIGLLPTGDVALIEVKDKDGDLTRAVRQVAAHMYIFGELRKQPGYDLSAVLDAMLDQKVQAGLIGPGVSPKTKGIDARLVPVVAAPDNLEGDAWFHTWTMGTQIVRNDLGSLLAGLEFWRLSNRGEILERRVV